MSRRLAQRVRCSRSSRRFFALLCTDVMSLSWHSTTASVVSANAA
jgi:hypothetical protein